jgi:hypothetical protein
MSKFDINTKGKPTIYRVYENALEIVFEHFETPEYYSGWTHIIRNDKELFKKTRDIITNLDTPTARKEMVLNMNHP